MPGRSNALFERRECVGEHRLCEFTGGFSPSGKPEFTAGTINAETLMRFKGNQSPAVVVLDFRSGRCGRGAGLAQGLLRPHAGDGGV